MSGQAVLDRFIEKNPLAVMTRTIMGCLMDERLDEVFEQHRSRQYDSSIKFSTVAMAMGEIALGTVKNRNQAYDKYQKELQASRVAFYGKVNRIEPAICEGVVEYSAQRAGELLDALGFQPWDLLPKYRVRIWDGNHLQKTEKRLTETRGLCAAPLPGTVVARFDPQTGLFDKALLLEDAHAQETTVLDLMAEDVQEYDLHVADRNFCVVHYFLKIAARSGCFLVRQHSRLKGTPIGKRKRKGRIETGMVYEQKLEIRDKGEKLVVRRITVELDEPTRDGDVEIHILTNVPAKDGDARRLAELYRQRWEIEYAFYLLTTTFNCEMKSNCYPRCALFQFCMAMLAYNCRSVLAAALYAEHVQEEVEAMSQYKISIDIVSPMDGMLTAINEREWEELIPQTVIGIAAFLRKVSRCVNVRSYRKSVRGPKQPPPERKRCKAGTHVSSHRLLEERKQRC